LIYQSWGLFPLLLVGVALLAIYGLVKYFSGSAAPEVVEEPSKVVAPTVGTGASSEEGAVGESLEDVLADWERLGEASRDRIRPRMARFASFAPDAEDDARAHVWMGKDLVKTVSRASHAERLVAEATAERHFKRAFFLRPEMREAYVALAGLWVNRNEIQQAIALLEKAVNRLPGLGVKLALLLDRLGEAERAAQLAESSAAHWRAVLREAPADSTARIELAGAEMLLGNDTQVLALVQENRALELGMGLEYGSLEVALRLRQALQALRATPRRTGEALDRLEEALAADPENLSVVSWISDLGVSAPAIRPRVRNLLQRLAAAPDALWKVHFALGMQFLPDKDYAAARPHFEKAYAMDQGNPILANNLAWCLANLEPPRLERALEMVQGVMDADAEVRDDPAYIDTRGQILIKMGMRDLEKALPSQEGDERRGTERLLQQAEGALSELLGVSS
jgi:tetratricopeptide (TPR) repeat protein